MSRRWAGVLLLLLAVVAVIAVQRLRGHHVPGTATAAPVSPPPEVGDCLLDPPDLTQAQAIYTKKPRPTGSCAGTGYGEITAVIDDPADSSSWPHSADAATSGLVDLAQHSCQAAACDYLGVVIPHTNGLDWSPSLGVGSVAIDPDLRQKAAGQNWRACALYVLPDTDLTSDSSGAAVTHTLRDAITTGAMSNSLGVCSSGAGSARFDFVACASPHTILFLALGSVAEPVQRTAPQADCRVIAQRLTGRADLLTDEGLQIGLSYVTFSQSTGHPEAVETAEIPAGSSAVCSIRSSRERQPGGSVFGLGGRPIPWS